METLDRAIDSDKHWFAMVLKFQVIPYSINFKFILHKHLLRINNLLFAKEPSPNYLSDKNTGIM